MFFVVTDVSINLLHSSVDRLLFHPYPLPFTGNIQNADISPLLNLSLSLCSASDTVCMRTLMSRSVLLLSVRNYNLNSVIFIRTVFRKQHCTITVHSYTPLIYTPSFSLPSPSLSLLFSCSNCELIRLQSATN